MCVFECVCGVLELRRKLAKAAGVERFCTTLTYKHAAMGEKWVVAVH